MTVGRAAQMVIALGMLASVLHTQGNVGAASEEDTQATDRGERHCVIEVVGEDEDGAFITEPERCFASRSDASRYASTSGDRDGGQAQSAASTIGVHFTGQAYTGSSVTVSGTSCSGGRWYATWSWNDNIESSYHYCGSAPTTFHDYSNCVAPAKSIVSPASTLGSMNNRTSCVQYG